MVSYVICCLLQRRQLGHVAPIWEKDESVSMCVGCQDKFTKIKRRHHCRACGKVGLLEVLIDSCKNETKTDYGLCIVADISLRFM